MLGIKLVHSQPGRPMGRGKIERGVRDYPAAVPGRGHRRRALTRPATRSTAWTELNDLLDRWVRAVYHARVHSETGETPQARYAAAGPPALPEPVLLREAFRWSAVRLVRKTATVAFEGNVYSVDPFLAGPEGRAASSTRST